MLIAKAVAVFQRRITDLNESSKSHFHRYYFFILNCKVKGMLCDVGEAVI